MGSNCGLWFDLWLTWWTPQSRTELGHFPHFLQVSKRGPLQNQKPQGHVAAGVHQGAGSNLGRMTNTARLGWWSPLMERLDTSKTDAHSTTEIWYGLKTQGKTNKTTHRCFHYVITMDSLKFCLLYPEPLAGWQATQLAPITLRHIVCIPSIFCHTPSPINHSSLSTL